MVFIIALDYVKFLNTICDPNWLRLLSLADNTKFIIKHGHPTSISENICSEDDLRSTIFGTVVVKFLACPPVLGFSNIEKKWYNCLF